jgi:hypothetical protein
VAAPALELQGFPPLAVDPRELLLLPDSRFQLGVRGGPHVPGVRYVFTASNLSVATVDSTGIITAAGSCPPLPTAPSGSSSVPGTPGYVQTDVCAALPNGALKRDCLIQKATQAGCQNSGTMIQALRQGSDSNYLDSLMQAKAYSIYQARAAVPLDETALKTGKTTIGSALTEFKRVNDQATSSQSTGLRASARDLCFQSGEVDKYDFCAEISDSSTPPFTLECLQQVFLKAGGQKAGFLYPQPVNVTKEWNSLANWSAVKAKISRLNRKLVMISFQIFCSFHSCI